jgi:hypothetical protein
MSLVASAMSLVCFLQMLLEFWESLPSFKVTLCGRRFCKESNGRSFELLLCRTCLRLKLFEFF